MYFLVEADSLEPEKVRENLDITQKSKPKESKVSITLYKYLCYLIKIKLSKLAIRHPIIYANPAGYPLGS